MKRSIQSALAGLLCLFTFDALAGVPVGDPITLGTILDEVATVYTPGELLLNSGLENSPVGQVDTAIFRWSTFPCPAAVKIKFFRRDGFYNVRMTEERGPFDVTALLNKVTLTPPVPVRNGDMVGYVGVTNCGGAVSGRSLDPDSGMLVLVGDVTGSVTTSCSIRGFAGGVLATNDPTPRRTNVLVAVASTTGNFGARFRTEVQLTAAVGPSRGNLVYRPENLVDAPSFSIPFDLQRGQTIFFHDFLGQREVSGKGSLDVVTDIDTHPPIGYARLYEEGAAPGTRAFTMPAQKTTAAYTAGDVVAFFLPLDLARQRMNVGVRTLGTGAAVTFRVVGRDGIHKSVVNREFFNEQYVQQPLSAFTGSAVLAAGDVLIAEVTSGELFMYGSQVDNVSNDPSIDHGTKFD